MNVSALEACTRDLFTDAAELEQRYPRDTVDKIIRVREMYTALLRTPSLTDSAVVKTFSARYKVSRPTAYSDLAIVKNLLPTLGREAREFHRWRTKEMLLETYRIAAAKMDPRTMERVAATYAKVFDVSKEEDARLDMSQVAVQPWVPTDDPSCIGVKPMENRDERIKALLEELSAKEPDIMDVSWEEADFNAGELFPTDAPPGRRQTE